MRQKRAAGTGGGEKTIREIRRATRRQYSAEVKGLRRQAGELKEVVAELMLETRLLKKMHDRGWGRRGMRYQAAEKLEIVRLVERSHLSVRWTLDQIGIPCATFYH